MKLIKPYFEIIPQQPQEVGMLKHIETCGRVAWKSEEKTTEDSYIKFIDMLKGVNHGSVLEHGTVYLTVKAKWEGDSFTDKYEKNKYSIVKTESLDLIEKGWKLSKFHITTNYRVLVENGWLDDLKYQCEPTEFHEKRISVRFTCDIGVSREFNRHRVDSIAEQSTRYCNFSKEQFGSEITFIKPDWVDDEELVPYLMSGKQLSLYIDSIADRSYEETWGAIDYWLFSLLAAEFSYFGCLSKGWSAQQARDCLNLSTKTELIHTAFVSDWKHFFDLRDAKGAHPSARELATPLHEEFKKLNLI